MSFQPQYQCTNYGSNPPPPNTNTYPCSTCGQPLVWVDQYGRWWCNYCRKYEGCQATSQPAFPNTNTTPTTQPSFPAQQTNQPLGTPCVPNQGLQSQWGVSGLSAVGYQGPRINFKIKIENSGSEPICDVRVAISYPKDCFIVDEIQKVISLLKPNESNTVTFYLRPTGKCGKYSLSGEIDFYSYGSACRNKVNVNPKEVEVIFPKLSPMPIDHSEWDSLKQRLITSNDETKDIPIGVEALSNIVFGSMTDSNMASIKQTTVTDGSIIQNVGIFAAKGENGFEFGARLVVMGGPRTARVLLTCFAENDIVLTGFHHAILDIIEKRTEVKQYLTDNIVIQHVKGDYISGDKITISDSVVHRSNIG